MSHLGSVSHWARMSNESYQDLSQICANLRIFFFSKEDSITWVTFPAKSIRGSQFLHYPRSGFWASLIILDSGRVGRGFDDDRDDSSAWYVIKCPLEILAWHLNHLWQFGTGLRPLHHTIFPISTFCQPWPWWQLKYDLSYVDHLSTIKMLIWNG